MMLKALTPPIPRLPVMGWQAFHGERKGPLPCLLDQPSLRLTTSGRASILLSLELLGIKLGDRVFVPTYHCPTMIAPIVAVGAEPVFYPIGENGGPQLSWLRQQSLHGVKCIIAAHYFGLPQMLQELRLWCDANKIALIEDCAHSLFGVSGARNVGNWGDIAIGSLTKFLPVPEGGCLIVNTDLDPLPGLEKPTIKDQLKAIVDIVHLGAIFGRFVGLNRLILGAFSLRQLFKTKEKPDAAQMQHQDMGNHRQELDGYTIDAAQCHRSLTWASAWVSRNAPRSRIVERRRRCFTKFAELLTGFHGFRPLFTQLPEGAAPYVFPLWVDSPDPGYGTLRELGVPVSRWDRVWPGVPPLIGDVGVIWSHHIVQLGCHQDLEDIDIQTIVSVIIQIYGKDTPSGSPKRTLGRPTEQVAPSPCLTDQTGITTI